MSDDEDIAEQADAALGIARRALDKVNDLEAEIDTLEADLEAAQSRIDELEERTDLLQAVQKASSLKPEERAVVCIQTLYNRASARDPRLAEMDVQAAINALGGSVKRHHIYPVFDVVDDLEDVDDDVLQVVREDRASEENTRIVLNLEAGELPSMVLGHELETGQQAAVPAAGGD
jgi:DNA repair exonuclease SbcCD ATPase subunit